MSQPEPAHENLEYVGFWARLWATIVDTVLVMVVTTPLLGFYYGWGSLLSLTGPGAEGWFANLVTWVLPAIAVILFWRYRSATPGKIAIGARIVDARTGGVPSSAQLIGRYLAYFVSTIPFCLGFVWVGLDARKQGWHDKLAGTVVVRRKRGPQPVRFG